MSHDPQRSDPRTGQDARAKVTGQADHRKDTATGLDYVAYALASAAGRGCTCEPTVTLYTLTPKITRAAVAHDERCPVVAEVVA